MGEIYQEQRRWAEAEKCFRKAIEIRPDSKRYQVRLENHQRERKMKGQ
jgi:hypothetical protein